ncbi:hypothetical protein BFJ66_g17719 [Fusarium oxysporum f. sp. cepae]|uniref:NADH:flavin oxidoreductase/NADH oxidase N-terminal domain-containing protein n=2 Tax=Fusarium oxysporum TaxID=5507 RepID=A0A3L6MQL5_FUSOX|nr:hypothetical protein BFJ65_g18653 [Fusarium oxysporum f. sp. cepae]RKK21112.1 hypothetical protein BFJ66_g17719 [Fusarium oxysporum f. sp. cepae]
MPPTRIEVMQATMVDPTPLSAPLVFEFSGRTSRNRFLKAAISERLATWDHVHVKNRGIPTKGLVDVYRRWGEGGFGIIVTSNVMIEYDQLEAEGNLIIPRGTTFAGRRFEAFKDLAHNAKKKGSLIIAQLSHPGRQVESSINKNPISASDIQLKGLVMGKMFEKPRPMERRDLDAVLEGFAHAAEYCYKAGFDGVQLHAAHGYLLAQFLAPSTNHRADEYGGSLTNRARLTLDIAEAIRARVPKSFILAIKLNSVEFQHGGFSTDDCKQLCSALEKQGFDFIELSGGTYESLGFSHKRESTKKREAFFLNFAETILPALSKSKTYLTGGLRTITGMLEAVGAVDGIGLGRPICDEFDLPNKLLNLEARSAIKSLIDEDDFALSAIAAGTQIRLVSQGKDPLDLSQPENLTKFKISMQKLIQNRSLDKENHMYGDVDIMDTGSEARSML